MFQVYNFRFYTAVILVLLVFFAGSAFALDTSRYIDVDEISKDMEGYCYTVVSGSKIEKFPLRVVSIIRNFTPGRDGILVIGTDETFAHIGSVRGCSGSPVYFKGRMAGALAAGWGFNKDPLYLVTPIKYMLQVGSTLDNSSTADINSGGINTAGVDFSRQLDLGVVRDKIFENFRRFNKTGSGLQVFPLVSSLPANACDQLSAQLGGVGVFPMSGGAGAIGNSAVNGQASEDFAPGGVVTIPLVSGDISLAVTGTITEVDGNKLYAFGHSFVGSGALDLPMAEGRIHTVVASRNMSFKLASPGKIVGAVRSDESPGIYGVIGAEPKLIPMRIQVNRYNSPKTQVYDCKVAFDRLYTPIAVQGALIGAVNMQGTLPMEHSIKYNSTIRIDGYDTISFENVSSGMSIGEVAGDIVGAVGVLLSNPYGVADVTSLDIEIDVSNDDMQAAIVSVELENNTVKAGDSIEASVVLQSHFSRKSLHKLELKVPDDLKPGKYQIMIGGGGEFERFLRKAEPYNFSAKDMDTLMDAVGRILGIRRQGIYIVMPLPAGGVVIEDARMNDLPGTRAMLLKSPKRTISTVPLGKWVDSKENINLIVAGKRVLEVIVE